MKSMPNRASRPERRASLYAVIRSFRVRRKLLALVTLNSIEYSSLRTSFLCPVVFPEPLFRTPWCTLAPLRSWAKESFWPWVLDINLLQTREVPGHVCPVLQRGTLDFRDDMPRPGVIAELAVPAYAGIAVADLARECAGAAGGRDVSIGICHPVHEVIVTHWDPRSARTSWQT